MEYREFQRWFREGLKLSRAEILPLPVTDGAVRIRVGRRDHCPVTLACLTKTGQKYNTSDIYVAAKDLELPTYLSTYIMRAADDDLETYENQFVKARIAKIRRYFMRVLRQHRPPTAAQ